MPAPSAIHRPARLASVAIAAIAILTACSAGATAPPATPGAASPAAVASQSPDAVATSPDDASPAAASGSPAPKGGRSYGGGPTDTPAPKPKTTPKPSPKPTVKTVTVRAASTGLGKVLVGTSGMTLYIRTSDGMNSSGCNGSCADNWPPFTVKSGTKPAGGSGVQGAFGTITRSDGTHQVTYKGKPLYYFAGDYYTGDTTGQGVGGIWYVAKP